MPDEARDYPSINSSMPNNFHDKIPTDVGEAEGPHTPTATSWCGLPVLMWFMFQSVHWPNRQDYGTPLEGAQ